MANGAFGKGTGESKNPLIVEDFADLNAIRNKNTKQYLYYKLAKHLDLNSSSLDAKGWVPIPDFYGSFDGNCQTITGLKINRSDEDGVGLFKNIKSDSIVCNLNLVDVNVKGHNEVGALIGSISEENAQVYNIAVSGTISGNNSIGGIIGLSDSRKKVQCYNFVSSCTVNGTDNIGGICGKFTSFEDTDANRCSLKRAIFYGKVDGANFITTNATVGLADTYSIYEDIYFDKDKIPEYYPDEHAKGVSKDYFYNPSNFTSFMVDLVKDNFYPHEQYVFKFVDNRYPTLIFQNHYYTLFDINGTLNKYDTITNTFVPCTDVPDPITYDYYVNNGLKDVSNITIQALRKVLQEDKHNIKLDVLLEGTKAENMYPSVKILKDKTSDTMDITITTIKQKDTLRLSEGDYNKLSCNYNYTKLEEKEVTEFPIIVNTEIEKESKYDDAIIANINYDKRQTNSTNYTYSLTYNNASNTKISTSAFNDNRYITITDSKEDEVKGVDLKVNTEINKPNKDFVLNGQTKYDTRIEKQSLRTNIIYTLYNTMGQENRGVHVDAYGTNKSRYVISVNNGKSWLTYNSSDNNWKEVQLSDVYDQGVTINDLASRTVMNALPTDYKSKIKIACAISSDAFNSTFHIHDLDIEFEDNNGPEATEIVNTTDHDYVYVKGVFVDKENDDVRYRVLSKNQVSPEYTQLYPNSDGAYLRAKNNEKFNFKFPLYKFSNGANYLKIETMDTRGVKSEKIINFTLIQGSPEIKIKSHNQFYADILMSHSMNRKFRFQIYINGTQKAPVKEGEWSEWLNPTDYKNNTFELNYTWNTNDVLIGLPNEIEIRVQDELKTITFTKFSIVGEYKSLLFKDENNFYYSTDTGDVLQTLDFGTVIGGINSDAYPVVLENKTGLAMDNIIIFPDADTQEDKAKIMLSFTSPDSPTDFVASKATYKSDDGKTTYTNAIKVPYVLENNDTFKFYVRIESTQDVLSYRHKKFVVLATGTPIDTPLIKMDIPATTYSKDYASIKNIESYDGEGLFDITIKNVPDKMSLTGKSLYVSGKNAYTWLNGRISEEDFMKNPLTELEQTEAFNGFKLPSDTFEHFSILWLDTYFKTYYGQTVQEMVEAGNLEFKRRFRTNEYYDGHQAWLSTNATNKDKTFTLDFATKEK